jgi:hypothetical protein
VAFTQVGTTCWMRSNQSPGSAHACACACSSTCKGCSWQTWFH